MTREQTKARPTPRPRTQPARRRPKLPHCQTCGTMIDTDGEFCSACLKRRAAEAEEWEQLHADDYRRSWDERDKGPRPPLTDLEQRRRTFNRHSRDLFVQIALRDGIACARCGSTEKLAVDHVVPMARGGSDDPSNLQILCKRCNSSKRDR